MSDQRIKSSYPLAVKLTGGVLFVTLFVVFGLIVTGHSHLFRAAKLTYLQGHVTANINDGKDFPTQVIASGQKQTWPLHENYNQQPLSKELDDFLSTTKSAAYVVIHEGKLHSEFYFAPYHAKSRTNSFSMAKSVLTMMVGAAIDDGYIEGFDDLALDYVPELKDDNRAVTLAHLSAMSSGVDWDESYTSPFSPTPKLLYGDDVESFSLSRDYIKPPGLEYYYASVSTQVLGIALERALHKAGKPISLSAYLSEAFWVPLGMSDSATWHRDDQDMELTYCCINSNARDFAKLGQLLLQKGQWKGKQLLSESFIERMIQPDLTHYYGHSIWIDEREVSVFYAMMGHLGQYIAVVPALDLVVVRLGETRREEADRVTHFISKDLVFYVEESIKRIAPQL